MLLVGAIAFFGSECSGCEVANLRKVSILLIFFLWLSLGLEGSGCEVASLCKVSIFVSWFYGSLRVSEFVFMSFCIVDHLKRTNLFVVIIKILKREISLRIFKGASIIQPKSDARRIINVSNLGPFNVV